MPMNNHLNVSKGVAATSLYLSCACPRLCLLCPSQEGPTLQQLLQHAFLSMPHLQQVLLVSSLDFDADIQQQQQQHAKGIAVPDAAVTFFTKATRISDAGPWLYACSRSLVLPPLQVHPRACFGHPWPVLTSMHGIKHCGRVCMHDTPISLAQCAQAASCAPDASESLVT